MRRKILLIALLVLLLLFTVAPLMSLPASAEENAEDSEVETADVQPAATIFTENFEGSFPGAWYVRDRNGQYGADYWGDTSYRAHTGSRSAWCAQIGKRGVTIFSEDFEGSWPGSWFTGDWDSGSGYDYWGRNSNRKLWGSYSAWCAQIGVHFPADKYDNNMEAYMYRTVSLSAYSYVELSYHYWTDCQPPAYDYLQVMYRVGTTWNYIDKHVGNSGGWKSSTVIIPTSANAVGFYFYSDGGNADYEGAYVDDVKLFGVQDNSVAHRYDVMMQADMYRAISLSAYSSVTLSYWYWTDCLPPAYDYLQVMYRVGTTWNYIDKHVGNSGGWKSSTVIIPTSANAVGFYFYSVGGNARDYEGAYVDDVVLTGTPIATYSVTIKAACLTQPAWTSVPIAMDGSPTGYSTPHTFSGLTGTHTFRVPAVDVHGHPFLIWDTGSTSRTITVSGAGTHVACYQGDASIDVWTNKGSYSVGETMSVYLRFQNPGAAMNVRVIIKLGLPGGGIYGPVVDTVGPLPAGVDATVLWASFPVQSGAGAGTYKWIVELRNPYFSTVLIDSDEYAWTRL